MVLNHTRSVDAGGSETQSIVSAGAHDFLIHLIGIPAKLVPASSVGGNSLNSFRAFRHVR